MAVLTEAALLSVFPELLTLGPTSSGEVTISVNPAPGDTVEFRDYLDARLVASFVADSDFAIGATAADTAANLATALAASGLFTAGANGATVYLSTVATGRSSEYVGAFPVGFSPVSLTLEGGSALLAFAANGANTALPAGPWGALHLRGLTLYAAHSAAYLAGAGASGGSASAGPVQSQTIAQISVTYANVNTSTIEAAYASTRYGIEFVALRDSLFTPKLGIVGRGTMQRLGS